jgi:hypothetical protein
MKNSVRLFVAVITGLVLLYSSCSVPDNQREKEKRDSIKNFKVQNPAEITIDCPYTQKAVLGVPESDLKERITRDSSTIAKMAEEISQMKKDIADLKKEIAKIK